MKTKLVVSIYILIVSFLGGVSAIVSIEYVKDKIHEIREGVK